MRFGHENIVPQVYSQRSISKASVQFTRQIERKKDVCT